MKAIKTGAGALLALVLLLSNFTPVDGCTTFVLQDGTRLVFGRNYDWATGVGLVMVNKRNVVKKAMNLFAPKEIPAEWVSLYGSVTFNQYGREYPMGGMNEAGLVVEVMWMEGSLYPEPDERPALQDLTWVQYQLDTARSVDEVLASDGRVRISQDSVPLHYLVCDQSGKTATVEFLDGKMVAHSGEALPYTVLANDTYADSLAYLKRHEGFGGQETVPRTENSLDRFTRACAGVAAYSAEENPNAVAYAFGVLENVSQEKGTMWSIVYDIPNGTVSFRTKQAPAMKSFAFADFDFDCGTSVRVIDMNTDRAGALAPHFVLYTREANRKLIGDSFGKTDFLKDTPPEALDDLAAYPETLPCKQRK